ncbi:hypothetical protein DFQ27_009698 [Actinomortierella ambigua]|uniref:Uncharacterized protein n=1 Tax=Actinomortierella ambigua TaxID=1343610 RepID=A0A9P6UAN6_9FUNG|nr:hypothetical protein DFQ27_009698 [Actinomortierella ambigua]
MTTSLMEKYKTLKAKRSQNKLDAIEGHAKSKSSSHPCTEKKPKKTTTTTTTTKKSKKTLSPPPPPNEEPSGLSVGEAFSYTLFLADWFAMFNEAIESASTSSSPSSSSRKPNKLGSDHSAHVDTVRKKKVVKALQKAPPSQVNEVIAILKAMPDPTIAEFKKEHSRQASRQDGSSSPPPPPPQDGKKEALDDWKKVSRKRSGRLSNEQETGLIDPESIHSPSSWWAVSFTSLLSSITVTEQDLSEAEKSEAAAAKKPERSSSWFFGAKATNDSKTALATSKDGLSIPVASTPQQAPTATKKSSAERLAEAAAAILAANMPTTTTTTTGSAKASKKSSKASLTNKKSGSGSNSSSKAVVTKDKDAKATLVSTINSLSKQIVAQLAAPPTHTISAYTYWWGYEIYVPHSCMSKLQRAANTSQIFFGFLSGAIAGVPGLAALAPLTKIISAWVGFQWAVIKAEDEGKGVVLSATWILPVALAPRSWDHLNTANDSSPKQTVTNVLKKITAG